MTKIRTGQPHRQQKQARRGQPTARHGMAHDIVASPGWGLIQFFANSRFGLFLPRFSAFQAFSRGLSGCEGRRRRCSPTAILTEPHLWGLLSGFNCGQAPNWHAELRSGSQFSQEVAKWPQFPQLLLAPDGATHVSPRRQPWVGRGRIVSPAPEGATEEAIGAVFRRYRGLGKMDAESFPRLAPWANICRRYRGWSAFYIRTIGQIGAG